MNAVLCLTTFCEKHGPRVVFCTQSVESDELSALHLAIQDAALAQACASCASIPPDAFLVSYDEAAQVYYASTASPQQADYKWLQEIALRSLTHEQCPGMDGPIVFGDPVMGYALAHMFKISDAKARGGCRLYSLVLVVPDEVHLVACWDVVTQHFAAIVCGLKAKSKLVYNLEGASRQLGPRFARQRMAVVQRSLAELVGGMDSLFPFLHAQHAWIIQSFGRRLFQRRIEGALPVAPAPASPSLSQASLSSTSSSDTERSASISLELADLAALVDVEGLACVFFHLIIGNQVVVRGGSPWLVSAVLDLLATLLPPACVSSLSSDTYADTWRCNLLGIPSRVRIPKHVDASAFVLVDMLAPGRTGGGGARSRSGAPPANTAELRTLLAGQRVCIVGSYRETTLGAKLFFAATTLDRALVADYVHALKIEWHNKAKAFFKFAKLHTLNDDAKVKAFLTALHLSDSDLLVLRFWTAGLARPLRAAAASSTAATASS
ncbi:folliculin [Thecamonas trahens ATCC 50062]|uniref:Folliculin n=1 Tax=Thecamonas trahens ATCC 50062 TaxID=461836 RepID=A0A0L0DAC7_THETB|nr:folliculin [Thecamonas trahens ATCC 50062]KNC49309.1 folliculin [Thecamonas trahens ATCC 50062]|eukprot:XP_013758019.1 folliculin [Thecamonas trahens ATCC 50062]